MSIVFWSLAFSLFIFIRYFALNSEEALDVIPQNEVPITEWLHFGVIMGVIVGVVFAIIEFIFNGEISKHLYLGLSIIIKSVIYLLLLIFSLTFISSLVESEIDLNLPNESGWWKTSETFWLVAGYFIICSLIFTFIKMMNEKFGRGVLFKMLIGKYRRPVEEKRIFMFIDLKSSTTIAETLGHYKYSQLIQDCFYDLNRIVDRYDAEIYQYVGDEAVLSWSFENGLKKRKCIDLYFAFDKLLSKRSKYYNKRYRITPIFKAGVHGGNVMVTEVGSIKKELAYHGDVINTASRIQELCNKFGESLLISEELVSEMYVAKDYHSQKIGDLLLKGKIDTINIFAINRK